MKYNIIYRLMAFTAVIMLSACASQNQTGFLPHHENFAPLKGANYEGSLPNIKLDNPEKSTIIIYSHGTTNSFNRENCSNWYNNIHNSFLPLENEADTYFYYLCSKVTDKHMPGTYMYGRAEEILKTVKEFIEKGVHPKNIFLAGQSAGGWSSLLLMEHVNQLFNAAIVTAPAALSKRSRRTPFQRMVRAENIKRMTDFDRIDALVFVYDDDAYERPKDLRFLTDVLPETVKMVAYHCGNGHSTGRKDCRQAETTRIIKEYIQSEKENFPN